MPRMTLNLASDARRSSDRPHRKPRGAAWLGLFPDWDDWIDGAVLPGMFGLPFFPQSTPHREDSARDRLHPSCHGPGLLLRAGHRPASPGAAFTGPHPAPPRGFPASTSCACSPHAPSSGSLTAPCRYPTGRSPGSLPPTPPPWPPCPSRVGRRRRE